MPSPCCPSTPEEAGAITVEHLKRLARQYPHLRPCPRHRGSRGTMQWIDRKACASCPRREARHE
ncbi:hypothetical protein [Nitratidesulfovibrio vulgaris]|uniref:hypothetical protein n=1 Tax=Nitratidesulfovibrio vulgaris TaxID=881 RepID=UPI002300842E|nr:hypothetical protein [Nitratidesulfovibrio vulgaris]WCB45184.1 hypothetical protein PH214_08800 [Nitratidesulfovibrio vulgaris]